MRFSNTTWAEQSHETIRLSSGLSVERPVALSYDAPGMLISIRESRVQDGSALREIERLAGEHFRDVGLDSVADDEPASIKELAAYALSGQAWVAVDERDRPVGYVLAEVLGTNAHIEQLTVQPDRQGAGIGRALVERVITWAAETSRPAITLTTFAEVPWNRPLYEHLGFSVIPEDEIEPELLAVRDAETLRGLDPATRVCMWLRLGT